MLAPHEVIFFWLKPKDAQRTFLQEDHSHILVNKFLKYKRVQKLTFGISIRLNSLQIIFCVLLQWEVKFFSGYNQKIHKEELLGWLEAESKKKVSEVRIK